MTLQLDRLDNTLLYVLQKAKEHGKNDLSKFELMKLIYLIEVNARQFIGESFTQQATFVRDKNGPISYDIYKSAEKLHKLGIIDITEENNSEYGFPRHCHSLKSNVKIDFSDSELVFLNSVLDDYLDMKISTLKSIVYETAPMTRIQSKEKKTGGLLKGERLKMEDIPLDDNILEAIMQ